MATCLKTVQLNGENFLAVDSTQTNLSACTYVVDDGASSSFSALWGMSISDAEVISAYVVLVWAIAYSIKLLVRLIGSYEVESYE